VKNGMCCFCSTAVIESGLDPCTLMIAVNGDTSQAWPCHAACFRERLGDLPYADELFEDDGA
jgi:hypothetical protein